MAQYNFAHLDDIQAIENGPYHLRAIRHHLGITTFGVNAMLALADGDPLVKEHAEAEPESSEELYVVISGRARFEIDGEVQDAPLGSFIRIPPGVTRAATAETAGTTLLVVGAGPAGRPYEPNGWELFSPLFPLFETGEYEEGADRAQALIADDPPYGAVYYNTACFESRAGRIDDALAHLRRAIELAPTLASLARDDEDFLPLQDRPAFAEIVGD